MAPCIAPCIARHPAAAHALRPSGRHALRTRPLHTHPRARRTFVQIASTFDAVYRVSAPKNTRLFLESIDFDAWADPYGSFGMGTLLALPLVPIRLPLRAPPSRHRR